MMELKQYQRNTLDTFSRWLETLIRYKSCTSVPRRCQQTQVALRYAILSKAKFNLSNKRTLQSAPFLDAYLLHAFIICF